MIKPMMIAQRGQAFETMMLVISVIVAVAILGILLMFIAKIGPFGLSDAKSAMKDGLRTIYNQGYGLSTPAKVTFQAGSVIVRGELTTDIPISSDKIKFNCSDASICGKDLPLFIGNKNDTVTVSSGITAYISVCKGSSAYYCVAINSEAAAATDGCKTLCTVT